MISHPMSFLTCLLRSFLKTSTVSKTASFPQKLLQCLTPFIIIKLFPTPNPSLRGCTLNPFILNLWLAYQTQALNTSPIEIQKGTSPEWKKASLDPMSSKCLPDGLWALDTQTEPLKHPWTFTWVRFHPCETSCRLKTKPRSYDWEQ